MRMPTHHAKLIVHDLDGLDRERLGRWLRAEAAKLEGAPVGTYARMYTARLVKEEHSVVQAKKAT